MIPKVDGIQFKLCSVLLPRLQNVKYNNHDNQTVPRTVIHHPQMSLTYGIYKTSCAPCFLRNECRLGLCKEHRRGSRTRIHTQTVSPCLTHDLQEISQDPMTSSAQHSQVMWSQPVSFLMVTPHFGQSCIPKLINPAAWATFSLCLSTGPPRRQ
jgi:hypothetical protein